MLKRILILNGLMIILIIAGIAFSHRGDIYSTRAVQALSSLINDEGQLELKQYDNTGAEWIKLDNTNKQIVSDDQIKLKKTDGATLTINDEVNIQSKNEVNKSVGIGEATLGWGSSTPTASLAITNSRTAPDGNDYTAGLYINETVTSGSGTGNNYYAIYVKSPGSVDNIYKTGLFIYTGYNEGITSYSSVNVMDNVLNIYNLSYISNSYSSNFPVLIKDSDGLRIGNITGVTNGYNVLLDNTEPVVAAGQTYTGLKINPTSANHTGGNVYLMNINQSSNDSDSYDGGLYIGDNVDYSIRLANQPNTYTLPACDESHRGEIVFKKGITGGAIEADQLCICRWWYNGLLQQDVYEWWDLINQSQCI